VQSSRRCGKLERALDWVIVWLKALGPNVPAHMAQPVSLWVKTKADAALSEEEDLRLRYVTRLSAIMRGGGLQWLPLLFQVTTCKNDEFHH